MAVLGTVVLLGVTLGLAAPAAAQERPAQRDSLQMATPPDSAKSDSLRQRVDKAAAAVMAALDSLAARSKAQSESQRPSGSKAAPDAPKATDPPRTITIDGLVMDETRTKIGQDFYSIFYSNWTPPEDARNFTITVQEQPMPSLGTRVTVQLNNQTVFQTRLQPRYAYIEQAAKRAVYVTWRRLQRGQATRKIY